MLLGRAKGHAMDQHLTVWMSYGPRCWVDSVMVIKTGGGSGGKILQDEGHDPLYFSPCGMRPKRVQAVETCSRPKHGARFEPQQLPFSDNRGLFFVPYG